MTITDKSAEKAKAIMAVEGKDNWGIRIYISQMGRCGPIYGLNLQEEQMPCDEVIIKNGLKVFVYKDLFKTLSGMQLDYYTDGEIEGFIFTGTTPLCSSSCSCCG